MRLFVSACLLFAVVSIAFAADEPKVPSEKELRTLAAESILSFNQALAAKDFTAFYAGISTLWQQQTTPPDLKKIFQSFIDKNIDLSGVARAEPVYAKPPAIDDNGVLVLEGNYPTPPTKVEFRLKYLRESSAWKLVGIKLDVKPLSTTGVQLPSDAETTALARQSLVAFHQAVQAKSFRSFYGQIASMWQKQTTAEQVQAQFQKFIDEKINLASFAKAELTFDPAPAIDEDGLLQINGSAPIPGGRARFSLSYLSESSKWKLVGINIGLDDEQPDADEKESQSGR
jgi:uncharacterized protein YggL (DUF469 family)